MGIAGLFGPESGSTAGHIHSICDAFEIPHLETHWDDAMGKRNSYSINLSPSPKVIGKVSLDNAELVPVDILNAFRHSRV